MILFSVVRLRRRWLERLARLVLALILLYLLRAAYHWFASAGHPAAPRLVQPTLYAAGKGVLP